MTAREIIEGKLPERLSNSPELAKGVNARCQIELTGEGGGIWSIDFTRDSDWVGAGEVENPQCELQLSVGDFISLFQGDVSGFELFTQQRLKVKGNIGIALKLNPVLEG